MLFRSRDFACDKEVRNINRMRQSILYLCALCQRRVPMVLNTSFNENEPVVCKPEEALDCFLRTRMDVLVMGEWVVERGR